MLRDYSTEIVLYWPTIERAWNDHADKHPIIECDLAKGQVVAYPAKEYIAALSDRTREETRQCYNHSARKGDMILFIRDSDNRVLQSYVFSTNESEKRKAQQEAGLDREDTASQPFRSADDERA